MGSKFIARKLESRKSHVIPEGISEVIIESVQITKSKHDTKQLAVVFMDDSERKITKWYSLEGFKYDESGSFQLDSEGARIPDLINTKAAIAKFEHLAYISGINEDTPFEIEDLKGKKVAICVSTNSYGFLEVSRVLVAGSSDLADYEME